MILGERFNITGYELTASIHYAEGAGRMLVMHNNSSHVLVASQGHDEAIDDNRWAVLETAYPYYDNDYAVAYRYALRRATDLAVMR